MSRIRTTLGLAAGPFRRRQGPRVFGVGAAKTGTHSLAALFADRVPSAHEADARRLIRLHLAREQTGDDRRLRLALRLRDRLRGLAVDASQVNLYLAADLVALFPDARFVLTLRPPLSWLRSMIDDSLRREVDPVWLRFRAYRFRPPPDAAPGWPEAEEPLRAAGLHRLDGYLDHWRSAIERVQAAVPAKRLLVVRTEELGARSAEIAAFCGIGGGAATGQAHAFANPTRFGVLARVPEAHLLGVADRRCGALARRLFPERDLGADVAAIRRVDAAG